MDSSTDSSEVQSGPTPIPTPKGAILTTVGAAQESGWRYAYPFRILTIGDADWSDHPDYPGDEQSELTNFYALVWALPPRLSQAQRLAQAWWDPACPEVPTVGALDPWTLRFQKLIDAGVIAKDNQ